MSKLTVIIEEIKNIKQLSFDIPTKEGVYILTGINGCGKSTLLTTLARISNTNAFVEYFKETPFDDFSRAKISYKIENGTGVNIIQFTKKKKNWSPTPKNSSLLKTIGSSVIYITTFNQRFQGASYEHETLEKTEATSRIATPSIRNAMVNILDNPKFETLRYQTIKNRGAGARNPRRGNKIYYIPDGDKSFSEINFSFGERMVLNALDFLEGAKDNSFLLIDEIELALHPIAQLRFYDYLSDIAKTKKIIVIIATHSTALIRHSTNRFFLQKEDDGIVDVIDNCYPSYILRDISVEAEKSYDYLFFVEDDQAKMLLSVIIRIMVKKEDYKLKLTYKIIRVGGWEETIRLMSDVASLPPYTELRVQAFPDNDASDSISEINAKRLEDLTNSDKRRLELYEKTKANITFLHITPELGVWNWICENDVAGQIQSEFESKYGILRFNVASVINEVCSAEGHEKNMREKAKHKLYDLYKKMSSLNNDIKESEYYELMYNSYVKSNYDDIKKYYKEPFCMIIKRKGKK
jgi:predicted ATPase